MRSQSWGLRVGLGFACFFLACPRLSDPGVGVWDVGFGVGSGSCLFGLGSGLAASATAFWS